jgi:nucleotide-binding universal stress UspA family protein
MTFPTKLLLATDGSKDATIAAQAAIELSDQSGAELHVVYVGHSSYPSPRQSTGRRSKSGSTSW